MAIKKDDRVDYVLETFYRSRDWRANNIDDKLVEYYKLYRSHREDKEKGVSNLFVPKPFEIVEVSSALLMSIAFPQRPYVHYTPRPGTQGTAQLAEETTNFTDYQLNEQMDILVPMYQYVKRMVAYGTAFAKVGWKTEVAKVRKRIPQSQLVIDEVTGRPQSIVEYKEVEQDEVVYNAPFFDPISIWRAYPHPDEIYGLKRKLDFVHQKIVTIDELESYNIQGQEPVYVNLNKVKKMGDWNPDEDKIIKPKTEIGETEAPVGKLGKRVELLEMTCEFGRRIITIANREILVRDSKNPFFHAQHPILSSAYCVDVEDSVYGISALDPNKSSFYELIDMRNQVMDSINTEIKAPLVCDMSRVDDEDNILFAPDAILEVRGRPDDVIKKLDIGTSAVNRVKDMDLILKSEIQSATGINDITKGIGTEGLSNDTASGIQMLLEQQNKRTGPIFDQFQSTCLKPLFFMMRHLNHQFLAQGSYPGGEVQHEHFVHEYDIQCTGSVAYTSRVVKMNQVMQFIEKFGTHPNIRIVPLFKEALKLGDYNNIDEIIEPNPEPPKEDVKKVYTYSADLTPDQTAQALAQDGIQTSEADLNGKRIEWLNKIAGNHNKVQKGLMGQGGPEQNVPARKVGDEMSRGAKQNANTSGR